jgi:ABC-2 type transport system ATP-binding protein
MHIEVRSVTKRYGRVTALDRVSVEIDPGQIVSVLGANGAGKTTLLKVLYGITSPESGELLLDGEAFSRERLDLRRRLGCLPDFPVLFPGRSILQNIAIQLHLYEVDRRETEEWVIEVLKQLDLLELGDAPVEHLSRGQAYKTALAALLAVYPEVWIIDEPFASGMDPQGIQFFKEQSRLAAGRGCTVIYTTQILDLAERFSDRVAILDHGELRLWGTVPQLQAKAGVAEGALAQLLKKLREEP